MPIRSINGDEGPTLAGAAGPSSHEARRGTGKPVILVHRPSFAAASDGLGDATQPELGFESLGCVAVRLIAEWSLPRMSLTPARGEGEDRRQLSEPTGRSEALD